MEAAAAIAFVGRIAPKLLEFLDGNRKLRQNLEHDITYIRNEFALISATIQQDDDRRWRNGTGGDHVQRAWIQIIRELAHAIEDCIDRFMHRVAISGTSWIRQAVHRVKTGTVRNEFAVAIRELKKISQDSSRMRETYCKASVGASTSSSASSLAVAWAPETTTEMSIDNTLSARSPVGMDTPRDELLELIQQQEQLKVISIVGFDGIGKTLLARHVYHCMMSQYEVRAWVCTAEQRGASHVLEEILRQLGIPTTYTNGGGTLSNLCAILRLYLGTKRFFIVIDDMQTEFWHDIKDAFVGLSGRILVTTAIQSVANACSSSAAHDHVYRMKTLPNEHSRQLFFKEVFQDDDPPIDKEDQLGSEALKKCDGLPLALVTTARYLQSTGNPTRENWATLCHNLGAHLETKEMLARMKHVLVHSYTSLVKHDVKTCLLYLGIYPNGRTVRRGSLIRKWCAEGFIQGDYMCDTLDVAIGNFKELVNRSIIQRTDASNKNSADQVKTYHTHGMMLEFILHMSKCDNFITLLYDQLDPPPPPNKIRWLSLHDASARVANDLSLVRSLTIFGKAHESVLDFSKYELLRVLDLEECGNHLEDKHLREICTNLLLLRYLSLGAAVMVTILPKEIKRLQFLETLDVRRTKIEILPTQVMEMPCLIHLFGKFKLQQGVGGRKMHKLQTWFSENSKLETLAGFIVDNNKSQGFAQLMEHMKHLTKVKIWCEQSTNDSTDPTASGSSGTTNNYTHVSKAIKGFIKRSTDVKKAHSLSLHFSEKWFQDLLMNLSLEKEEACSCYLSSLKLQGDNIGSLPPFVTMLGGLTKLCLSSPHQLSGDILAALSRVRCLVDLKLIASQLAKLVIVKGALGSLRRLCIVVEVMTELEVQEGALPLLESLQLLCKDLNGFCGTTIQSLRRIKEVSLYDGVSDETKHEWKEEAKKHPRRPKLLFVKTAEEVHMGSDPADNSESSAVPTTDTTLPVTAPHDAISTEQSAGDDDQQHDEDDKEDTDNIDILEDFASKTCLDPLMNKEGFEQEIKGVIGLVDQQMEDTTWCTGQANTNHVHWVVDGNRRKRARTAGEGNSMDKVVDRVKRKNLEDVPETRPTKQTAPGLTVPVSDRK
ncbi:disease resistance protein RGA4-like [Hordeum vulgare subsp. vulgare]|uniref:NB-ARC domain-containing protein n=1 Tax=Hordeum vulgare subsp. vulgare TaxID=112509 RepID=A0A8I6XVI7_HORVV|nr:disease resistance protein RGA4-like [Hordeum vulgare subsp. vulgare]